MFLGYLDFIDEEFAQCGTLKCLQQKRKELYLNLQETFFSLSSLSVDNSNRMDFLLFQAYIEIKFFNKFLTFGNVSVSKGYLKFVDYKKRWTCEALDEYGDALVLGEFKSRLGLAC